MGKVYNHLSLCERRRLFIWYHYEKRSVREIGRLLDRSHSTISREIRRHIYTSYVPTYYPNPADHDYKLVKRRRAERPRLKNDETKEYVITKLKEGWSPEIISGRLRIESIKDSSPLEYACHESIYQYIYKENRDLISALARKHKRRKRKHPSRSTPNSIANRTPITMRPEIANNREEIGHWESDSIISKGHNPGCNVVVERVTRLVHISKVDSLNASDTTSAIISRLSSHPDHFVKSITYDNGSENTKHLEANKTLGCSSYFCSPYSSWEKGSVEQVNGLIRRYYPKGTDFREVSDKALLDIERQINNRPRKCLGYKTPIEAYAYHLAATQPSDN